MDIEQAAQEAAGNWKELQSFGWHGKPDDCDLWAIVYTHNRDSGSVDRANSESIAEIMEPYTEGPDPDSPDCVSESHNHWACGWVDGYSIRVYTRCVSCNGEGMIYGRKRETDYWTQDPYPDRKTCEACQGKGHHGEVTEAFKAWCEIADSLENYPILDEEKLSEIEHQDETEAWDSYGREDFSRALEQAFELEDMDVDTDALDSLWYLCLDRHCYGVEHSDEGPSFPVGDAIKGLESIPLMQAYLVSIGFELVGDNE